VQRAKPGLPQQRLDMRESLIDLGANESIDDKLQPQFFSNMRNGNHVGGDTRA
jgi:hypothetical protein